MVEFEENWNNEHGLKAKHGNAFKDDYNSLGYFGWQQLHAMLVTWAKRELFHNHATFCKKLAEDIVSSDRKARVVLGPHQAEQYGQDWYFHVTVMNHSGKKSYHFFVKVTDTQRWPNYTLQASFCGVSCSKTVYLERYRFVHNQEVA